MSEEVKRAIAEGIARVRSAVTDVPLEVIDADKLRARFAMTALGEAGYSIYRREDVAALVEFYEALLPRGFDGDYVLRCEAAAQAITPEVLARAKEATR